jgi:hypothetical protein
MTDTQSIEGTTQNDLLLGSSAEGAGLEPDPMVIGQIGVNHLEAPASITLLPARLAVESCQIVTVTQLAQWLDG